MNERQPEYLRVRNWENYQLYKDGRPMKFFIVQAISDETRTGIFDNPSFLKMADDPECPVFRILGLAAQTGNKLPNNAKFLQQRLFCERPINLQKMIDAGVLEPWHDDAMPKQIVYFARSEDKPKQIKIGYTTNPKVRVQRLNAEIFASFEGTRSDEREILERFEHLKIAGEWFRETREIIEFSEEVDTGVHLVALGVHPPPVVVPRTEQTEENPSRGESVREGGKLWRRLRTS